MTRVISVFWLCCLGILLAACPGVQARSYQGVYSLDNRVYCEFCGHCLNRIRKGSVKPCV
jgi:hypothetical protein